MCLNQKSCFNVITTMDRNSAAIKIQRWWKEYTYKRHCDSCKDTIFYRDVYFTLNDYDICLDCYHNQHNIFECNFDLIDRTDLPVECTPGMQCFVCKDFLGNGYEYYLDDDWYRRLCKKCYDGDYEYQIKFFDLVRLV